MKFKAFIPILSPLVVLKEQEEEKEFIYNTFQRMISELNEEGEYSFFIGEHLVKGYMYIEEKEAKELSEKYQIENTFRLKYCLNIDIDLNIDQLEEKEVEEELRKRWELTEKEVLHYRIENITEELKKTINDFKIAVNIAFPSFFEIGSSCILVEDKKWKEIETSISGGLEGAILSARKKTVA